MLLDKLALLLILSESSKAQSSTCQNVPNFISANGRTCTWFEEEVEESSSSRCDLYGALWVNDNGQTANTACCACNGGSTHEVCNDLTVNGLPWTDLGGDSCEWYEGKLEINSGFNYSDQDTRCSVFGKTYFHNGYTAEAACCICGGGIRSLPNADAVINNNNNEVNEDIPNFGRPSFTLTKTPSQSPAPSKSSTPSSTVPSTAPSMSQKPTISNVTSSQPSASPSTSQKPSTSMHPSLSLQPSISSAPSESMIPSASPTSSPTVQPSKSFMPTGAYTDVNTSAILRFEYVSKRMTNKDAINEFQAVTKDFIERTMVETYKEFVKDIRVELVDQEIESSNDEGGRDSNRLTVQFVIHGSYLRKGPGVPFESIVLRGFYFEFYQYQKELCAASSFWDIEFCSMNDFSTIGGIEGIDSEQILDNLESSSASPFDNYIVMSFLCLAGACIVAVIGVITVYREDLLDPTKGSYIGNWRNNNVVNRDLTVGTVGSNAAIEVVPSTIGCNGQQQVNYFCHTFDTGCGDPNVRRKQKNDPLVDCCQDYCGITFT